MVLVLPHYTLSGAVCVLVVLHTLIPLASIQNQSRAHAVWFLPDVVPH